MTLNLRKKPAGVCLKRERVIRNWYVERRRRALEGGRRIKQTRRTKRGERNGGDTRFDSSSGANHPNAIIISSVFQPRIRRNYASPVGVVRLRSWQLETDDASGLFSLSLSLQPADARSRMISLLGIVTR